MPLRIPSVCLCVTLCHAGVLAADGGYPVEVVIAGFEKSIAPVKSIEFRSEATLVSQIDLDDWFRHFQGFPATVITSSVVQHCDGRFYMERRDQWNELFDLVIGSELSRKHPQLRTDPSSIFNLPREEVWPEISRLLPSVRGYPLVRLYDGGRIWDLTYRDDNEGQTIPIQILPAEEFQRILHVPAVLEIAFLAFPAPQLTSYSARRLPYYLPTVARQNSGQILPSVEVDGAHCARLDAGRRRIYLDVNAGFAVRRSEHLREDGRLWSVTTVQEFSQPLPGFWFPKRIVQDWYGDDERAEGRYAKMVSGRTTTEVSHVVVNALEHEGYLSYHPQAGDFVDDVTLTAIDPAGNEVAMPRTTRTAIGVRYVVPDNPADLPEVIRRARLDAGLLIPRITGQLP